VVKRDSGEQNLQLDLPKNRRANSDISRRVGTWPMRAMALGGLFIEDLSDEERAKRNIDKNSLALFVKHAGEYGEHAAAKKAGFQKDDVLVALEEMTTRTSESEVIGRILQKYPPGTKLPATVLRGDKKLQLQLPVQ
jgi:S1-C subfamily serine protease